ncbi:MAG: 4a-hydroxytetrahydrobiopterin dehydratase [Candidatus Tectomicrobia bacterium]|uniref:Putative pterin-4-alpha-carbinolamine dehydratase n=1 Tax=Tectimicrobiota bacterium TaxID=2528274 RepID=A0A937W5A8_UNCTE|nr:4a-hydroxytetrahydrobiopterin dehydratase [Candidatus Tectomicrobia bacterium]
MADRRKLSEAEVQARLAEIPGWELRGEKLHKEFRFASFVQAFSFMTSIALVAEAMNHHPDWCNVYNRVTIDLNTHEAGGISALDFTLATRINDIAG